MGKLLFCNIGWMNRYEGLRHQPDKIVGGGKHVAESQHGHEVCNFLNADDGFVYGHVETIKGEDDRQIDLGRLGCQDTDDSVSGIDVVWTATNPTDGGRRVVGWYRNATVFRERQYFERAPSKQHKRDKLDNHRIRASAENVHRLEIEDRTLTMRHGSKGWMGHTPWWYEPEKPDNNEVQQFIKQVRNLMDGVAPVGRKTPNGRRGDGKSPSPANDTYVRYIRGYEIEIHPRHNDLQKRFVEHLNCGSFSDIQENLSSVDLRFRNSQERLVLAEVKPCDKSNARFAIRTAIGQLLDYRQRCSEEAKLLIVLELKPGKEDRELAGSNGFGLAFPTRSGFEMVWPGV
jgi:hypothetical protein